MIGGARAAQFLWRGGNKLLPYVSYCNRVMNNEATFGRVLGIGGKRRRSRDVKSS